MPKPIPRDWCDTVVRILRTNNRSLIDWTFPARQRWASDTFGAWEHEAYEAIISALEKVDIEGNETTSLSGQLAVYEFLFLFGKMLMYGKIALKNDRVSILILSAHKAARKTLSI